MSGWSELRHRKMAALDDRVGGVHDGGLGGVFPRYGFGSCQGAGYQPGLADPDGGEDL
jgi:hypothetical protein